MFAGQRLASSSKRSWSHRRLFLRAGRPTVRGFFQPICFFVKTEYLRATVDFPQVGGGQMQVSGLRIVVARIRKLQSNGV